MAHEIRGKIPKDYEKNYGHELEDFMIKFLQGTPGFVLIERPSKYDDQFNKIDLIITLEGGKKFALQISASESQDVMRRKLTELVRHPVIKELHDDTGNVTSHEVMPVALAGLDMAKWSEPNKAMTASEKKVILERMAQSLTFAKGYQQDMPELFNSRIDAIQRSLEAI